MPTSRPGLTEKRRILQLETLYDLAITLHATRPEQELLEELLQRVCAVLDPSTAVGLTRDPYGDVRSLAVVGWQGSLPPPSRYLADPLWGELLAEGGTVSKREGVFAGRPFRDLLATPLAYRGVFLGFLVVLDKETRGGAGSAFSDGDRRFLGSVAALVGVSLDGVRRVELLETQREALAEENKALKGKLEAELSGHRIVAYAAPMRRVLELVERIAPRGVNVLVRGESGTGKELVAKLLHHYSQRSGPLIALNCAALPESLLESELFGIEGGVATGVQARRGKFELADRGTLFLDEIGDLEPALQAKLLRAIQEREIVRVGGELPKPVDTRLVAATHEDLESRVQQGRFREDLYYRLKVVELELPALRDRRRDIPHLVRYFTEEFCRREGIPEPQFASEALSLLLAYDYPGNVRELQNLVEGAVTLAEGEVGGELIRSLIGLSDGDDTARADESLDLAAVEQRHIVRVLRMTDGNKTAAARVLGVDRRTLQRKGF